MIFITTSNGVFALKKREDRLVQVMSNKHTRGWFKPKARGYFGICQHQASGDILAASRERLGTPKAGKPSTDCKLHRIDPQTLEHQAIAELRDLHDVHQIAAHGEWVFLSDTGKNRVHLYDLKQQRLTHLINVGEIRDDINHINALYCDDETLLIGLNNRGSEDSAILHLPYTEIAKATEIELDALALGTVQTHVGIQHTHDIELCHGNCLCSASHAGYIFASHEMKPLIRIDNWVRGICCDEDGIWVGTSPLASRKERHSEKLESCINLYAYEDYRQLRSIRLPGSGQVNDILCLPD